MNGELEINSLLRSRGFIITFAFGENVKYRYSPIVHSLGLVSASKSGWATSTKFWPGNKGGCFYSAPGVDCESTVKLNFASSSSVAWASKQTSGRQRNQHADSKLRQYVNPLPLHYQKRSSCVSSFHNSK